MEKILCDLKKGQSAKVLYLNCDVHLKRRLLELGILKNEVIKILSVSPLKNSYLIAIKNYSLALRKNILQNIIVEIIWIILLHL